MSGISECPSCGHSDDADFIAVVGQCPHCEEGLDDEDCYYLDSPFPDYSDVPEKFQY